MDSTTQHLSSSFSDSDNPHPSRDTCSSRRRKSLRAYGRQTIVKPIQGTSSTSGESNADHEKRRFQSVYTWNWSTNLNTTGTSSSAFDVPKEVLPMIALIPPTPCGSVGFPTPPPDSPITIQKFVAARSSVLLKRRSSFVYSAPPLVVGPCLSCSRPERFLSEDDLSCRNCRKRWLACQLWYQACDGGRMERLRVPFVQPGESNAVNRALSVSLGLLPPSVSNEGQFERVVEPRHIPRQCLSAFVKSFRSWVGRKGRAAGGNT